MDFNRTEVTGPVAKVGPEFATDGGVRNSLFEVVRITANAEAVAALLVQATALAQSVVVLQLMARAIVLIAAENRLIGPFRRTLSAAAVFD